MKKRNIVILVISTIIFLFMFIWTSLHNLSSQNIVLITFLLNDFNIDKPRTLITNHFTANLDYILKTPNFFSQDEVVYNVYNPLVYIYNTHDTEKYQDNKFVTDASLTLSNNLRKLGVVSLVEQRLPSKFENNGLSLYDISKSFILDTKKKYSNIEYFIDIHRDSVKDTTIIIKNKKYARVLFVLGLDNPNYRENKRLLEKMHNYLHKNYPGISKGILEKSGKDVNGVYNQDIDKNILLIEIGGVENNLEEVNNSTEIIALMLYNMLGDENEKVP